METPPGALVRLTLDPADYVLHLDERAHGSNTPASGVVAARARGNVVLRFVEVAAVGGIRDPEVLATARRMMKSDPIFRDTALFFHRRFDAVLGEFATDAEDDQILAIADTRSGRAFMLLARLSGAFE